VNNGIWADVTDGIDGWQRMNMPTATTPGYNDFWRRQSTKPARGACSNKGMLAGWPQNKTVCRTQRYSRRRQLCGHSSQRNGVAAWTLQPAVCAPDSAGMAAAEKRHGTAKQTKQRQSAGVARKKNCAVRDRAKKLHHACSVTPALYSKHTSCSQRQRIKER